MVGIHLAIVVLARIINKNKLNIESPRFIKYYSALTEGLQTKKTASRYWNIILMLRWGTAIAILVLLRDYFCQQIQLLLAQSLLM